MVGLREALRSSPAAFLIVSPTGRTSPDNIPLRGYAGPSGRLDVVARAFEAVVEDKALAVAVLLGPPEPPVTVVADSRCRARLGGERGFIQWYLKALTGGSGCPQVFRGVGLRDVLSLASRSHRIVYLREGGVDVMEGKALETVCSKALFVLGSHLDIPPGEERVVRSYSDLEVSLGPVSYHTEHAVAFIEAIRLSSACSRETDI